MKVRQLREYPHLVELIDAAEKHCVMYAAQRVVVDDYLSTDEDAAELLYNTLKRICSVRRLIEQRPPI